MTSRAVFTAIGLCASFVSFSQVHAAEPTPLNQLTWGALRQRFYLQTPQSPSLAASPLHTLKWVGKHVDTKHIAHERFQQYYLGIPVFGGYGIVHHQDTNSLLAADANRILSGRVYSHLEKELDNTLLPTVMAQEAQALTSFKSGFIAHSIKEESINPIIYIDDNHHALWAYKVSLLIEETGKRPERPIAIIAAKTFEPLIKWNEIKTWRAKVKGLGFGGNSSTSQLAYGVNFPALDLTRSAKTNTCYMENEQVRVVHMHHTYSSSNNEPMSFECKAVDDKPGFFWTGLSGDGYDKDNGGYSPSNDALYDGYVIDHMYQDWFGLNPLVDSEGKVMKLIMRVHYGYGYENAFWDGRLMTFGDGDLYMHPLVSLGVAAHEISHGFTEQHSNLIYTGQSGAMNESFSDMAAQAAEFYSTQTNSWKIGADIFKKDSGYEALRFMDNPRLDGRSIDSAADYQRYMDVHYASGVYNRLFYLLAHQPGWDTKKAFSLMIKANVDYWTPYSSFVEGGCGLLHAAKDLGYEIDAVQLSLGGVAIDYHVC